MIYSSSFIISSPDVAQCPQNALPEYAFVGRSNVGKSSLINMLTNHAGLAKTSQKPGKTLLINHFAIHGTTDWQLVDLPGYGYAQQGKRQRERLRQMIERYCLLRTALTNLFVLIDSRHAPQQIDLDFITWLGENAVPFAIVFTKIDKISQTALAQNVAAYENTLRETWEELPPMFVSSAVKKMGRDELLKYIEEINEKLKSE